MTKDEQIKEMANVIFESSPISSVWRSDAVRFAKALYNAGYRKQEWISVEERLPDIRQKVLLYSPTDGINIGHRCDENGRFYVGKAYPDRPTHWMSLPTPPKMKGGAE